VLALSLIDELHEPSGLESAFRSIYPCAFAVAPDVSSGVLRRVDMIALLVVAIWPSNAEVRDAFITVAISVPVMPFLGPISVSDRRGSSDPGAFGRPPGSICSPTRRFSRSSVILP
jgi:hypothetical protein